jgi:hypothetical protein
MQKSVHVKFVVDKVALVQVSLQVLQFSCQYHFTVTFHTHHLRMNSRPVGGCSSETQSHLIDMKSNKTTDCMYSAIF